MLYVDFTTSLTPNITSNTITFEYNDPDTPRPLILVRSFGYYPWSSLYAVQPCSWQIVV
jgi:hypothetical protein